MGRRKGAAVHIDLQAVQAYGFFDEYYCTLCILVETVLMRSNPVISSDVMQELTNIFFAAIVDGKCKEQNTAC